MSSSMLPSPGSEQHGARPSGAVLVLGGVTAVLMVVATLAGLLLSGGPGAHTATTVRGATAEIYGHGLYKYDGVFSAAGQHGTDAIALCLGVPLLVVCLVLYRRGSLRAALLLSGAFGYVLYVYSSLALGYAFNDFFLIYVAIFAASLWALVLLLRSIDLGVLPADVIARLPRRSPMAFLFFSGAVVAVIWLQPVIGAVHSGGVPARMDMYTTAMTYALDLAVIAPAALIAGYLILKRRPLGYLAAFPLLGIILLLGPSIAAQTVSQLRAGIDLTPGEVVGPVAGFLVVCAWAIWVIVSVLRVLPRGAGDAPTLSPAAAASESSGVTPTA